MPAATLGRWLIHGIALAQRLPADSSAPRTADRLQQQLGRRTYAHRGLVADTFPLRWKRNPGLSPLGRLIRRTWYAGCARCCAYLPIACLARWGACPSKACFGQFSLLSIGSVTAI
jgi:hypothetical protein